MSADKMKSIENSLKRAALSSAEIKSLTDAFNSQGARKTDFFKIDIYATLFATEAADLARALTFIMYVKQLLVPADIKKYFEQAKQYPAAEARKQVEFLVRQSAPTVATKKIVIMSAPPKPPTLKIREVLPAPVIVSPELASKLDAVNRKKAADAIGRSKGKVKISPAFVKAFDQSVMFKKTMLDNFQKEMQAGISQADLRETTSNIDKTISRVENHLTLGITKNIATILDVIAAVEGAHADFAIEFKKVGESGNLKLKVFSKLLTTVLSEIPFGGKTLASIAETAIGQFKYDTQLLTDAEWRKKKAARDAAAKTTGFEGMMNAVSAKAESLTSCGVGGDRISTQESLSDRVRRQLKLAQGYAEAEMRQRLKDLFYEDTLSNPLHPSEKHKVSAVRMASSVMNMTPMDVGTLSRMTASGMVATPTANSMSGLIDDTAYRISLAGAQLAQAIDNFFNRQVFREPEGFRNHIHLMLWKEYLKESIGEKNWTAWYSDLSKADPKIPDAMVDSLRGLGIIQKKTSTNRSDAIYKSGAIPYEGHKNHKIGIYLFFKWYDEVNPFDLIATPSLVSVDLNAEIRAYITAIGHQIEAAKRLENSRVGNVNVGRFDGIKEVHDDKASKAPRNRVA